MFDKLRVRYVEEGKNKDIFVDKVICIFEVLMFEEYREICKRLNKF